MRRYPPRAFAGAGAVFVVPRVGDADAQHEVVASAQSGFVVSHVGDPLCSDAASAWAFAGAGAVFFVGKGRSEVEMWLEYVAYHGQACPSRAFALPRRTRQFAGVPKTQSICRGFARVGLLALRACSGMRFRLTPFVFAAGFCASEMRFCDGIAARAGRRRFDARFKSLLRGCGSYAFLACRPGRLLGGFPMQVGCVPARLAGTPLPAGFVRKQAA